MANLVKNTVDFLATETFVGVNDSGYWPEINTNYALDGAPGPTVHIYDGSFGAYAIFEIPFIEPGVYNLSISGATTDNYFTDEGSYWQIQIDQGSGPVDIGDQISDNSGLFTMIEIPVGVVQITGSGSNVLINVKRVGGQQAGGLAIYKFNFQPACPPPVSFLATETFVGVNDSGYWPEIDTNYSLDGAPGPTVLIYDGSFGAYAIFEISSLAPGMYNLSISGASTDMGSDWQVQIDQGSGPVDIGDQISDDSGLFTMIEIPVGIVQITGSGNNVLINVKRVGGDQAGRLAIYAFNFQPV